MIALHIHTHFHAEKSNTGTKDWKKAYIFLGAFSKEPEERKEGQMGNSGLPQVAVIPQWQDKLNNFDSHSTLRTLVRVGSEVLLFFVKGLSDIAIC